MARTPHSEAEPDYDKIPKRQLFKHIGPGLVLAATGVGAGDLITSIVAGNDYGYTLVWAVVLAVLIKYPLSEGIGRWSLISGKSLLHGWHSLGRFCSAYFVIFLMVSMVIVAAGMTSVAGLAEDAMFPDVLPVPAWAILNALIAFFIVGFLREYHVFELIMKIFVGLMFTTMLALAVLLTPSVPGILSGFVPQLPDGSLFQVLAIIGGFGGVHSLTYYPYWARSRGWTSPRWLPVMRADLGVGYLVGGLFVLSLVVIASEFLFESGIRISDRDGLVLLAELLGDRFGTVTAWIFLIGFWAAVSSSVIGNWNGASQIFSDFVRLNRKPKPATASTAGADGAQTTAESDVDEPIERDMAFYFFLCWITFLPIPLLFLGNPVFLVIAFTVMGSLFFPFLAVTLFCLLNSKEMGTKYRNGFLANAFLVGIMLFFGWGMVRTLLGLI